MKDRIPLYPGRVKLTPVSGKENTYDMVRADEPQVEGTPLNKATFLTDETAEKFGLTSDSTPNDVFEALTPLNPALGKVNDILLYVDNVFKTLGGTGIVVDIARIATGSYVGTGTYGADNPCSLTFDFEPKFIQITSDSSDFEMNRVVKHEYINGSFIHHNGGDPYHGLVVASLVGNTYTWYNTGSTNAWLQLNAANKPYRYIAIG